MRLDLALETAGDVAQSFPRIHSMIISSKDGPDSWIVRLLFPNAITNDDINELLDICRNDPDSGIQLAFEIVEGEVRLFQIPKEHQR